MGCTRFRRSTAGCRFFQRLAYRLDADPIDQAEDDQFVGQQLQRPVATALGRIAAGQRDEPLLDIPLDLDLVRPRWLPLAQQGNVQSCRDQLSPNPRHRPQVGAQSRTDLLIGVFLPAGSVGKQEDAGMGQFAGRCLAAGNQLFQIAPFFRCQSYPILFHGSPPILEASSADRQESGYCVYLSNEDG